MPLNALATGDSPDGQLLFKGARRGVTLSETHLTVEGAAGAEQPLLRVPITEIFGVERFSAFKRTNKRSPWTYALTVHGIKRKKGYVWRQKAWTFLTTEHSVVNKWADEIERIRQKDMAPPKRLRVFINPQCGSHKAVGLFQSVLPLFRLASVSVDPTITTHAGHARTAIQTEDLSGYDGIVMVGGDGFLLEAAEALMLRQDGALVPIGVIPGGSTNTVAWSVHGTGDVTTAALHIIVGDRLPLDLAKVKNDQGQTKIATNFISYGFFSDTLVESARHEWMGPRRYDYSGFLTFMRGKAYDGELSFLLDEDMDEQEGDEHVRCQAGCAICQRRSQRMFDESSTDDPAWHHITGSFKAICVAVLPLLNKKAKHGVSPFKHLCDGAMDLIVVDKCSRMQFLSFLLKLSKTGDHVSCPHCKLMRCKAVRFKPRDRATQWNVDGEIFPGPDIEVTLLPRPISLMCRGIERAPYEREMLVQEDEDDDVPALLFSEAETTTDGLAPPPPETTSVSVATHEGLSTMEAETNTHMAGVSTQETSTRDLEQQAEIEREVLRQAAAPTISTSTTNTDAVEHGDGETSTADLVRMGEMSSSTRDLVARCDQDTATQDLVTYADAWCQWETPWEELAFSIPLQGCSSASCNRGQGRFPCYAPTCPYHREYPVFKPMASPAAPRMDRWALDHPGVTDPFDLIEQFVERSKLRLVDLFKSTGKQPNAKGVPVKAFREKLVRMGLNLNDLQFDELIHRLDRNNDSIISYRDMVTARRKWVERMKALDPRWTTRTEYDDEQVYSGAFLETPRARPYYPPV